MNQIPRAMLLCQIRHAYFTGLQPNKMSLKVKTLKICQGFKNPTSCLGVTIRTYYDNGTSTKTHFDNS